MKKLKIVLAVALIGAAQSAYAVDLTWGGFGSAYYGQALTNDLLPIGFSNQHPDFTNFSLFGLNVGAKVDDHFSVAAELVANGTAIGEYTNFNVATQWAYINYAFDDATQIRAGRQRLPIFTASEYINEHWELPFRELPQVVYRVAPFTSFDGFSISHGFDTGVGKLNVAVFGGTPLADVNPATATVVGNNMVGARVNLEGDGWRVRAQANRASETLSIAADPAFGTLNANLELFSVGYRFDKYNIVSWGEYIYRHSSDGTPVTYGNAFDKGKAGYVLVGYRLGNFLPRYTFAQNSVAFGFDPPGQTTSHTIGVNYYATPKIVAKAEFEHDIVGAEGTGYNITQPAGATSTTGNAVYAGVDYAF